MNIQCPQRESIGWASIAACSAKILICAGMFIMALNCTPVTISNSWGQSTPSSMTKLLRGEVTSVGRNQVVIGDKPYDLTNDVVIKDDRERPLELKNISMGDQVSFHLRQGLIDQLVLILPK